MIAFAEKKQLPSDGILESFTDLERVSLGGLGEMKKYDAGDTIITEGDEQDKLYILVSGRAKVLQKNIAPVVTAWIGSGQSFGEMSVLDAPGRRASASVIAIEDCEVWTIRSARLGKFLETYPNAAFKLAQGVASLLCKRIRTTNSLVYDMSLLNTDRVNSF